MQSENDPIFLGLEALGGLLASRGQAYSCVVAGGASLAALGVLVRVTKDVDVMAVRDDSGVITIAPALFPVFLEQAIREVATELKLEAASDDPPRGRTKVHAGDLVALDATPEELDEAAKWVRAVNVDPRRDETIEWVKRHVAERRPH